MTIKIIKSSKPNFWYADKIDQEFEARFDSDENEYYVPSIGFVEVDDCVVVSNTKFYQIDFGGNVLAQLKIENGKVEVLRAINGGGYGIEYCTITEVDEDARKL